MILDNEVGVPAPPDDVFALINDVERVARCLPGASLEGRDGDTYRGRVTVKVGPIKTAYAGTLRFLDVDPEQRQLRLAARGTDTHGHGDAEAEVDLSVVADAAAGGSTLRLHTNLVIRGKVAQFGKGAIGAVSGRLLGQFAQNLGAQLAAPGLEPATAADGAADGAAPRVVAAAPAAVGTGAPEALDGLAMLLPPGAGRVAAFAATAAVAFFQGWLLGRVRTQDKLIKELWRGR